MVFNGTSAHQAISARTRSTCERCRYKITLLVYTETSILGWRHWVHKVGRNVGNIKLRREIVYLPWYPRALHQEILCTSRPGCGESSREAGHSMYMSVLKLLSDNERKQSFSWWLFGQIASLVQMMHVNSVTKLYQDIYRLLLSRSKEDSSARRPFEFFPL